MKTSTRFDWRSRTRAAAIHFAISMAIAVAAAALVFGIWFPEPYGGILGGTKLFQLLVSVDVVLGPLLTWLVFDRRKPRSELVRDLTVVGLLQCAALGYGMWSVYQARPVYLVHEVDRLVAVSAAEVDPIDLPKAAPAFQRLPFHGVKTIGVRDHLNPEERTQAFELALAGKDIAIRPEYWQDLSEKNMRGMRERSKPFQALMDRSPADALVVKDWLRASGKNVDQVRYLPMVARDHFGTALLDQATLEVIGYLPVDGF